MNNNQCLYNIFWIDAAVKMTAASLYIEYYPCLLYTSEKEEYGEMVARG